MEELADEFATFVKGMGVMPVFKYIAKRKDPDFLSESGTIVAQDEREAIDFFRQESFHDIRLRKLTGLEGVWKRLTADIS